MSLLPQTILPATEPIGRVNEQGEVIIDKNWWLLFFNLCTKTIGTGTGGGGGTPSVTAVDLVDNADLDAVDVDAQSSKKAIENALIQALNTGEVTAADFPDISRALLMAQDPHLQDPVPQAQPIANVAPTGSPFTYKAPFPGFVILTSGTVSDVSITRAATTVTTGQTAGLFPVSRFDSLVVTYTGAPTMKFVPWSSQ